MIRQPIICVMGHVDHGKTTLLDKIRSSTIAAKEAGGITQHIGASEVSIDIINNICKPIDQTFDFNLKIPGLLFIDTPGHEAFTNLRKRGGSIADIAILVVDVMAGFAPQTVEAINILKEYKTPFIVAANKIDLINGWHKTGMTSIISALKQQNQQTLDLLETKLFELMGNLSEYGFNSERFDRIKDFKTEIAIVPISAKTGEGLAELLMLISGLSQKFLEMKLNIEVKGPGKGNIIEKKEITGLGTTIDIILYNGSLHINDIIAFATPTAIATAKIKALLKPKAYRHENNFEYLKEVYAACGVKISANGLEDALPGSPIIQVINNSYIDEIKSDIKDIFEVDKTGVILKTDTIGSLEAISRMLKNENFNIGKKAIGNITKRDVLDAFAMNVKDPNNAIILGFNVSVDKDAEEAAEMSNVKIINENIIYKIIDEYKEVVEKNMKNRMGEIENKLVFPGKILILPNTCFRVSHPAIFGIEILGGKIKPGYVLINEENMIIGKVEGIENEGTPLTIAKKGDRIAISVSGAVFGRQLKDGLILYSKISKNDEKLLISEFSYLLNDEEKELLGQISQIMQKK